MAATDLYRRAFARAAQILGGRERLLSYLKIDLPRLKSWSISGTRPPLHILLAIAQVVKQAWLKKYRRSAPRSAKLLARRKKSAQHSTSHHHR
jgi:hypothetical protein